AGMRVAARRRGGVAAGIGARGSGIGRGCGVSAGPDYAPLWAWVRKREAIRVRKEAGQEPPYTDDPILRAFRFCNVRREDDRVTVWIRDHIRRPYADHPHLWFMLCIARQINWPETLAELITSAAWPDQA